MAKIEGTQDIPSELQADYIAQLARPNPQTVIGKRYPFRLPAFQKYGKKVSAAQQIQRTAFLASRDRFNALPEAERERWYAAAPIWISFLWYYNWFMLNAVPGLWGVVPGGGAILKGIQHIRQTIPTTGAWMTLGSAVDPAKCVIMFNGAAITTYITYGESDMPVAWGIPIYPVYNSFESGSIFIAWAITPTNAGYVSATIIEYI